MFAFPVDKDIEDQLRMNALLFRGLMEFPLNILSKAAQIKSGMWRRNGPSMIDEALNYAEPPFCRSFGDADMLLLQFSLICHSHSSTQSTKNDKVCGLNYSGQGTVRFVNLLMHRFGVFDFLGFEKAPNTNVDRYNSEIKMGLYSGEQTVVMEADDNMDEGRDEPQVLPWTYCPATDPVIILKMVNELLHLIIILITVRRIPDDTCFLLSSSCLKVCSLFFVVNNCLHPLGIAVAKPKR